MFSRRHVYPQRGHSQTCNRRACRPARIVCLGALVLATIIGQTLTSAAAGGSSPRALPVVQASHPTVKTVKALNLPALARASGKPLLVEVEKPFWRTGRDSLVAFRNATAEAAREKKIATVFLVCARAKKQVALVRSVKMPVPVLVGTSAYCGRDVKTALGVDLESDRYWNELIGRLFLPDGTLARLDYQWEIPLRELGIDPASEEYDWMNLPALLESYDISSLYADSAPVPDPTLMRGIKCSGLPAVENVQPTCDALSALNALEKKGKPLVVVGFAKYCPFCQKSTAEREFQAWADRHPDYTVVAITPDDPVTAWLWARYRGWHFLVLANAHPEFTGGAPDFGAIFKNVFRPLGFTYWGDHKGGDIPGDPFPTDS
jgi:thiol-disulfide isomerase/thioredoxin